MIREGTPQQPDGNQLSSREVLDARLAERALSSGYESFAQLAEREPNAAHAHFIYAVGDAARATGETRQSIIGLVVLMTEEDKQNPILDDDADPSDRLVAFQRFMDRHRELGPIDDEQAIGASLKQHIEKNRKKD